ncbi:MAG: hypothetical protein KBT22_09560 [Bacteroidales bacterium]|nr:hypothetical protein [Candidatus Scybalocola fimicaballi]
MELNTKTILKFALIAVVAYASRPLSDAIVSYFKSTVVETKSVESSKQLSQACVSGTISDHDYVDLGLSVKWAICNVGASSFTDYGDYFAWGETEPKEDYSWKTYMWCNGGSETINKYRISLDYVFVLESLDDAATVNWGEKWRMPTIAELKELKNECEWEWNTINGVNGYKITAKNNNWIFLPAAGSRYGTSSYEVGSGGSYWSSSVSKSFRDRAYGLYFGSSGKYTDYSYYRTNGRTVRPVIYVNDNVDVDDNVD